MDNSVSGAAFSFVIVLFILAMGFHSLDYTYRPYIWSLIFIFGLISLGRFTFNISIQLNANESYLENLLHEERTWLLKIAEIPKINDNFEVTGSILGVLLDTTIRDIPPTQVKIWLKGKTELARIAAGDLVSIEGRLEVPDPEPRKNAFDYSQYLRNNGIHYLLFGSAASLKLHKKVGSRHRGFIRYNVRQWGISTFQTYLSEPSAALSIALVLGHREYLDESVKNYFRNSGSIHVLAVSGLHVGLIMMLLKTLLDNIIRKRANLHWLKTILLGICLLIYSELTGGAPPVQRSAIMFFLILIGWRYKRQTSTFNILAATALIMLVYNPLFLFQVSFQLSFAAVLSIVFFYPFVYKSIYTSSFVLDHLWKLSAVGISAQILTFPMTLYYFHQFPVYFILSGIVAIFFVYMLLLSGFILLVSSLFSSFLTEIIAHMIDYGISLFVKLIKFISLLPGAISSGWWITIHEVILLYLALILVMTFLTVRNFVYIKIAFTFIFIQAFIHGIQNLKCNNQILLQCYPNESLFKEIYISDESFQIGGFGMTKSKLEYLTKYNHLEYRIVQVTSLSQEEIRNIHEAE